MPELALSSGLAALLAINAQDRLPPVEQWNPPFCGDSEMRIAADGQWYHQGAPIQRPEMVRLFSRILRREPDGRHMLVTPVEMLSIAVDDAPFVAMGVESEGEGRFRRIGFQLNTGDVVIAGPAHGIRVAEGRNGPRPYLGVRAGLEALIARPAYYELAQWALAEEGDPPGLWSEAAYFPLGEKA